MSQAIFTVSNLTHYLKETLDHDMRLQSILIKGEISNFTNHRSGHWYFTLKDVTSKINCVMFSSYASRSRILLKEGMKVLLSASVSMYEANGSIQLYVTNVQIDGLGDLFLQLEQIKERLHKEGLFEVTHKKPLPEYPMRIGVVTAKTGAAVQDILTTIARRWPLADVIVHPTLVQGIHASKDIMQELIVADREGYDVILLARGGGAIEDLWCFNDEQLARTIFHMNTVLVTGVGHETDTTLVDFVSDARAPTPTAAAELITPEIEEVNIQLALLRSHLIRNMNLHLQQDQLKMKHIQEHRYMKEPLAYIREAQMKLAMHVQELSVVEHQMLEAKSVLRLYNEQLTARSQKWRQLGNQQVNDKRQRILYAMTQFHKKTWDQLQTNIGLLDAFSPLKILSRGYHITYHDGHIVKCAEEVEAGDVISMRMQDGVIEACVQKKEIL